MKEGSLYTNDKYDNYTYKLVENQDLFSKIYSLAQQVDKLDGKYGGIFSISFYEYKHFTVYDSSGHKKNMLYCVIEVEIDSFKISGELRDGTAFYSDPICI